MELTALVEKRENVLMNLLLSSTDLRPELLPVDTCPKNSTTEVTLINMTI